MMNNSVRQFLALAKQVSLREDERSAVRMDIAKQTSSLEVAKSIALSATEKEEGKDAVASFVMAHPKRAGVSHSLFDFLFNFSAHRALASMVVVALLVTMGGTVTYAAEESLPGDLLYPIKTEVTEPLIEKFTRDPEARAAWNVRRIERRLEEAETLGRRKELNAEHRVKLETRIEMQIQRLEEKISQFDDNDEKSEAIQTHLEKVLEHHEQVLSGLENGEMTKGQMRNFVQKVRRHKEDAQSKRMKLRERILQKKNDRVHQQIAPRPTLQPEEIRERIEERIEALPPERREQVEEKVEQRIQQFEVRQEERQILQNERQEIRTNIRQKIEVRGEIQGSKTPFQGSVSRQKIRQNVKNSVRLEVESHKKDSVSR